MTCPPADPDPRAHRRRRSRSRGRTQRRTVGSRPREILRQLADPRRELLPQDVERRLHAAPRGGEPQRGILDRRGRKSVAHQKYLPRPHDQIHDGGEPCGIDGRAGRGERLGGGRECRVHRGGRRVLGIRCNTLQFEPKMLEPAETQSLARPHHRRRGRTDAAATSAVDNSTTAAGSASTTRCSPGPRAARPARKRARVVLERHGSAEECDMSALSCSSAPVDSGGVGIVRVASPPPPSTDGSVRSLHRHPAFAYLFSRCRNCHDMDSNRYRNLRTAQFSLAFLNSRTSVPCSCRVNFGRRPRSGARRCKSADAGS